MNLRRINYHCSCGSCDECTGGNAKSYFEGMEQKPNIQEIIPIAGPSGKASLTVASVTDGTTDTAGTDVAIGGSTIADLTTLGFDVTTKPTLKVTPDPTDLNNTKVFIRESNGFLNFLASFKTKLLPSGSEGNILKYVSGLWTSAAPDWEKYNTTTTSPYVFSDASIGVSVPLTVGAGLAYRFKHVVAVVDPSDSDKYMEGVVESYSGTLLTIKIKNVKGTGNTTGYNVMLTAPEYLPYVNNPANYGKFFYNNSGVIEMRTSIESIGDTKWVWHASTYDPTGWIGHDGVTRSKFDYPALYEYFRTRGTPHPFISGDNFILPNMNGRVLAQIDPAQSGVFDAFGSTIGVNKLIGGIPTKNLPVISPWGIDVSTNLDDYYILTDPGLNVNHGSTGSPNVPMESAFVHGTLSVTPKNNNIAGGQSENGAQDLDIRQPTIAARFIIKAN